MPSDKITSTYAAATPQPLPADTNVLNALLDLGGLADPGTFKGFTTHDIIGGLNAVCVVIDSAAVDGTEFENPTNTPSGLVQAAKVLSSILSAQVKS